MSERYLLLIEDEPLILMDLEYAAEDRGYDALCASSVARALDLIDNNAAIVAAVLDVSLRDGENCVPIARELDRRGIPYVLHSGDLDRQDEVVRNLDGELIPKPAAASQVIGRAIELGMRDAA